MKTLRVESGFDFELDGTITMDDAGVIGCTVTPAMCNRVGGSVQSVYVHDGEPRVVHVPKPGQAATSSRMRAVTRSDPKLWFEELPPEVPRKRFQGCTHRLGAGESPPGAPVPACPALLPQSVPSKTSVTVFN